MRQPLDPIFDCWFFRLLAFWEKPGAQASLPAFFDFPQGPKDRSSAALQIAGDSDEIVNRHRDHNQQNRYANHPAGDFGAEKCRLLGRDRQHRRRNQFRTIGKGQGQ